MKLKIKKLVVLVILPLLLTILTPLDLAEAEVIESAENIVHTSDSLIEPVTGESRITPIIIIIGIEQWLLLQHGNVTDVI